MNLIDEEKIIQANPKHLECPHCGHEEDIRGACVVPSSDSPSGMAIMFGSDADFCTKCDKPWGRNEEG